MRSVLMSLQARSQILGYSSLLNPLRYVINNFLFSFLSSPLYSSPSLIFSSLHLYHVKSITPFWSGHHSHRSHRLSCRFSCCGHIRQPFSRVAFLSSILFSSLLSSSSLCHYPISLPSPLFPLPFSLSFWLLLDGLREQPYSLQF